MVLQQAMDPRPPFYLGGTAFIPPPSPAFSDPSPHLTIGIAAILAGCITHPIDQTKIRTQVQLPGHQKGMLRTFAASFQQSGTKGLWDGVSASVLRQGTYSTTRFGVYAKGKAYLEDRRRRGGGDGVVPGWQLVGCGTVAGALGGLAGVPTGQLLLIFLL